MPVATLPVAWSHASFSVAFATGSTSATDILTRSERREHDRLSHGWRRRDWLAGRCAAKQAVAARCGASLPLEKIQLEPRVDAAPRCMMRGNNEPWTPLPLTISIAHRDGVAIAVAADEMTRVGVDIERAGDIAPEQYRYFLTARERLSMERFDATLVWVLKEAAWKALGLAPDVPFTDLQLEFAHDSGALQGVRIDSTWMPSRAYVLRSARPRALVAAVLEIGRERQ